MPEGDLLDYVGRCTGVQKQVSMSAVIVYALVEGAHTAVVAWLSEKVHRNYTAGSSSLWTLLPAERGLVALRESGGEKLPHYSSSCPWT